MKLGLEMWIHSQVCLKGDRSTLQQQSKCFPSLYSDTVMPTTPELQGWAQCHKDWRGGYWNSHMFIPFTRWHHIQFKLKRYYYEPHFCSFVWVDVWPISFRGYQRIENLSSSWLFNFSNRVTFLLVPLFIYFHLFVECLETFTISTVIYINSVVTRPRTFCHAKFKIQDFVSIELLNTHCAHRLLYPKI
jgi:hypothetical protein